MNVINLKVHQILANIRQKLVELNPKQTGSNKFQNFEYYQLADFLPFVIKLANAHNLSYQETFGKEEASLTLIDTNSGSSVTFSIPIDYSVLKGGSPMQSIGASVTYARRYLWVSALGLTDHDLLDQMNLDQPITQQTKNTTKDIISKAQARKNTIADQHKTLKKKEVVQNSTERTF